MKVTILKHSDQRQEALTSGAVDEPSGVGAMVCSRANGNAACSR